MWQVATEERGREKERERGNWGLHDSMWLKKERKKKWKAQNEHDQKER